MDESGDASPHSKSSGAFGLSVFMLCGSEQDRLRPFERQPDEMRSLNGIFGIPPSQGNWHRLPLVAALVAVAATAPALFGCRESQKQKVADHKFLAERNLREGRADAAILELEKTLRISPEDEDALSALGEARLLTGQPGAAYAAFRKLVAQNPNRLDGQLGLARLYLKAGELKLAKKRAAAILAQDPSLDEALWHFARGCLGEGDPKGALSELDSLSARGVREPGLPLAKAAVLLSSGRLPEARHILGLLFAKGQESPETLLLLAQVAELQKDDTATEAALTSLCSAHPGSPAVWTAYGDHCLSGGRAGDAFRAFQHAAQLGPESTVAWERMAEASVLACDLDAAKEATAGLRLRGPHSSAAVYHEGRLFLAWRRFDEAGIRMQQVLKEEPDHFGARYFLGLADYGQRNPRLAKASARKAVSLDPSSAEARILCALVSLDLREAEEARQCIENFPALSIAERATVAVRARGLASVSGSPGKVETLDRFLRTAAVPPGAGPLLDSAGDSGAPDASGDGGGLAALVCGDSRLRYRPGRTDRVERYPLLASFRDQLGLATARGPLWRWAFVLFEDAEFPGSPEPGEDEGVLARAVQADARVELPLPRLQGSRAGAALAYTPAPVRQPPGAATLGPSASESAPSEGNERRTPENAPDTPTSKSARSPGEAAAASAQTRTHSQRTSLTSGAASKLPRVQQGSSQRPLRAPGGATREASGPAPAPGPSSKRAGQPRPADPVPAPAKAVVRDAPQKLGPQPPHEDPGAKSQKPGQAASALDSPSPDEATGKEWRKAEQADTKEAYREFLTHHPNHPMAEEARRRIAVSERSAKAQEPAALQAFPKAETPALPPGGGEPREAAAASKTAAAEASNPPAPSAEAPQPPPESPSGAPPKITSTGSKQKTLEEYRRQLQTR